MTGKLVNKPDKHGLNYCQASMNQRTGREGLGYTLNNVPRWNASQSITERIREIETGLPERFRNSLQESKGAIERLLQEVSQ